MTQYDSSLIFDRSRAGRAATAQAPRSTGVDTGIPDTLRRQSPAGLPAVSEMDVVRHYTRLSQKNFSIDTQFYPLGSCTMKYNPRACNSLAMLPEFLHRHPLAPPEHSQGFLQTMFELQEMLREVTGMNGVSLTPMAGAQGEFAGVAMIRAYHRARGDDARSEIIVPDAAHGTNPATAIMCGYRVREIPTDASGDVDLDALRDAVGPQTAGIMLTNPSTLGVFERHIHEIAAIVHDAGGLLYYDGANLNAILGKVRPGDMGFDVIHMNLHKTFSTPHGGGGPGAGAVGVSTRLLPFLPVPVVIRDDAGIYRQGLEDAFPESIGRLSAFAGNAGVLLRAYVYMRMLGREGMIRVAEYSTLNANYLMAELQRAGFDLAFPERRATHEFIVTLKRQARETGLTAMDMAKRLLDHDYHAPTTYFPLLVPECLLIEPTETESRETLDGFVAAMVAVLDESRVDIDAIKGAPHRLPNRRFNEVAAAKRLDVVYQVGEEQASEEAARPRTGTDA
ncbi:Glycine dehydrogenase [decarboxylating] (glycine cleavage system P2 protein) [Thioalkalivibrio nitratireducens DSM 14787]|uniref:Probable glycine dehydrogenase (decarboxylating) subunit 2 n=1 Tax=Thioalkalivibrio nitratireducens (strain DSM 14787 / UNIQEM 213 / ALEN2) TaxID=1255043 RepID=L0DUR9_THIND|nr:aminomethyl-transferring glycine dehydrogenase subunit GcvPB [Thioalkalivibrio nitratireducens]AGA32752.1 Glycine dehydrogenase [decarboxylating] (glycine cleavage system P2 protein) [Thioalkalivibrio nitratireducens DSM 14787]